MMCGGSSHGNRPVGREWNTGLQSSVAQAIGGHVPSAYRVPSEKPPGNPVRDQVCAACSRRSAVSIRQARMPAITEAVIATPAMTYDADPSCGLDAAK